ncbi:hypothetical protein [Alistipes sp.]|uniref:hypothetical protein n=1 Tax=Alistipes sp. TaxID=1872444 RepID=UPI0025BB4132|nr:hypothetical protein [Alistipes sp.]
MKRQLAYYCAVLCGLLLSATACQKDFVDGDPFSPDHIEEGVEGVVSLDMVSAEFDDREILTRSSTVEETEQHIHSVYLFIVDMSRQSEGEQYCKVLARRYFSDLTPAIEEVEEDGKKFRVNTFLMPAVSCRKARIFAIANVGYSNVQSVDNDEELLVTCDTLTSLRTLLNLQARLTVNASGEVNVERMQGHHLMSGFFGSIHAHHYTDGTRQLLSLKPDPTQKRRLVVCNGQTGQPFRPLGSGDLTEEAGAVFVHRLDSKVTVNIIPDGKLKETPGAYFRLKSWQVINAPTREYLYWFDPMKRLPGKEVRNSKVFMRDITSTEGGGWKFTFYPFENYFATQDASSRSGRSIDEKSIAAQYNRAFDLTGDAAVSPGQVVEAFGVYPNKYSVFAYSMRELCRKYTSPDVSTGGGEYDPQNPGNDDQTITVYNGEFENAPSEATYLRLQGYYFNPQEPVHRRVDDPRNAQFPEHPVDRFPYWDENQQPTDSEATAAKRSRVGNVTYYVHLGYVGADNYEVTGDDLSQTIGSFDDFKRKVNDYNLLRNNHYTYNIRIAGIDNIKLEATRENGGNIFEQEKQPGAEGIVSESQHFFELDAHYETRNLSINFARFPEDYDEGFSFALSTPYELFKGTLKRKDNGEVAIIDEDGKELSSLVNHDFDWIHFAWHGTPDNPSRSLIDPRTMNGINYSETYGGYERQKTYLARHSTLTRDMDATHRYRLLDALEFTKLVWTEFCHWKAEGKPLGERQYLHFTFFVDEFYYDFNPVTGAAVDWTSFCNVRKRKALFFMENEELSADGHSVYSDTHVVVHQNSIQTLYATRAESGQLVANVAFGIEGLDEFLAKYRCWGSYVGKPNDNAGHYVQGTSLTNGLFNSMQWYNQFKDNSQACISWSTAALYFDEKGRMEPVTDQNFTQNDDRGRNGRRAQWAVFARNRDLNRNGRLDADEIRWFLPAIDQYTMCFLGGRPVFENPLFERDRAIVITKNDYIFPRMFGVPFAHFMSSTNVSKNRIFWAEEGCSKGDYGQANLHVLYGLRMARMLTNHGVDNTGVVFANGGRENDFTQDPLFIVTESRNGAPVAYEDRVNGKNYYIVLNKMNPSAFRDHIEVGEIGHHTHEDKRNWLFREFKVARYKVGYTAYTEDRNNEDPYDRTIKIDGVPRTWWQVNGVWSPDDVVGGKNGIYFYRGPERSLAYDYSEELDGTDLHHWRMPNLREGAIMSMSFNQKWFGEKKEINNYKGAITTGTESENLGPTTTKIPYWEIRSNTITRLNTESSGNASSEATGLFYVRGVQDVR